MKKKHTIGIDARMFSDAFTGIGRYTYELTYRFFEKNPDIQWVLFMNDPEFSQYNFPHPHVRSVCVNAAYYSLAEQTRFLKILEKEKCDLVHFTHFNVPLFYRRPFVVTIHDTTISFYPGKKMNVWWRKYAYQKVIENAIKKSQKIITVSDNTKKDIEKLFSAPSQKIQTIWNGIGDDFKPISQIKKDTVREKFGINPHFLLYTGVWREHKNLVNLLRAFRLILDKAHKKDGPQKLKNLHLVLTGKEDPYYPEVKKTIHDLDLTSHIKHVGLVDREDLQALYSAAGVYVFPSLYEGFGLPPLEAMKCHTPVCASRISSIPEVCGDAVEYFDPHNVLNMAEKIMAVLTQDALREELILKGQKRVTLFSWDKAAEQTLHIYRSVLENI